MLIAIDPTKNHLEWSKDEIMQICGLIPEWCVESIEAGSTMLEHCRASYCSSLYEFEGGRIDKHGVYHSDDGDPPLYPLLIINDLKSQICYQYLYGIIAFSELGKDVFITRMD